MALIFMGMMIVAWMVLSTYGAHEKHKSDALWELRSYEVFVDERQRVEVYFDSMTKTHHWLEYNMRPDTTYNIKRKDDATWWYKYTEQSREEALKYLISRNMPKSFKDQIDAATINDWRTFGDDSAKIEAAYQRYLHRVI